jgi:hypothetical protein
MPMATLNVLAQKLQYVGGIDEMLAAWSDAERRQEPQGAKRQEHGARLEAIRARHGQYRQNKGSYRVRAIGFVNGIASELTDATGHAPSVTPQVVAVGTRRGSRDQFETITAQTPGKTVTLH